MSFTLRRSHALTRATHRPGCVISALLGCCLGAVGCASEPGAGASDSEDGTCARETRGQTYADGSKYEGQTGTRFTLLKSVPAPPAVGDNAWTLTVSDAAGSLLAGADIALKPMMVDHGHGSASATVVTELEPGVYRAEPVNLSMPGFWDTTVAVATGDLKDRVHIGFCVE
jgi:hypothetical protein